MDNSWAIHQLYTTTNFANNSRLFSWYVGGLNFQVEHHLFPGVCHVHYRKISKIVRDTAKEFNLPYNAEPTFVGIFRDDLTAPNTRTGPYLPLKDEEGVLGVLIFEAERPEFLTDAQRELAGILANQTAVAMRNAQLYHQVPMVHALGSLAERRREIMKLPRRRRYLYAGAAVGGSVDSRDRFALPTLGAAPLRSGRTRGTVLFAGCRGSFSR